jgi:cob(I)alamin adenosyltransferase
LTAISTKARILLFTGDGKGKTTAALGMVLRSVGHGMRAVIVQFIKNDARTGEIEALSHMQGVTLIQVGRGFIPQNDSRAFQSHRRAAEDGLTQAEAVLLSGSADLLVLDEIAVAIARGLIDEHSVIGLVAKAGPGIIIVMTGRSASPALMDIADTVTEMRALKHGYECGIAARQGVEY